MISETYWDALTELERHIDRVHQGLGNYRSALADIELRYLLLEVEPDGARDLFDKCVERFPEIDLFEDWHTRLDRVYQMVEEIKEERNV